MKKHTILSAFCGTAAVLLLTTVTALAQQPGSGGPTPIPIDGGASLLLASGVAFGLKKLRDRRRAK